MGSRVKQDDDEEEGASAFSLSDVVSAVRARIKLIALISIVVTGVAAGIIWTIPNRYEAVASVQIDQRNKEIINIKGVISDLKADAATVDSEVEVIRSKQILHRVIDQLGLRDDYEFSGVSALQALLIRFGLSQGPFKAKEARPPASIADLIEPSREPERDEVGRAFEQRLKVVRVRTTLVIEIHFSSADPVKAARIANAIIGVFRYAGMPIEQANASMDLFAREVRPVLQATGAGLFEPVAV